MRYEVKFARSVKGHLEALTAGQRARVFDAIDRQLTTEPLRETRNRKPMRPNPMAPWELRVGELRVFYEVQETKAQVQIVAVGIKVRNKLRIGGEEIDL